MFNPFKRIRDLEAAQREGMMLIADITMKIEALEKKIDVSNHRLNALEASLHQAAQAFRKSS